MFAFRAEFYISLFFEEIRLHAQSPEVNLLLEHSHSKNDKDSD
jgi:hypothetical protein